MKALANGGGDASPFGSWTAGSRVLVIGDSNIYPRRGDRYQDMWVARLKRVMSHADFIVLEAGGRTTEFLVLYPQEMADGTIEYSPSSLEAFEPHLVIVQLGIVDCAPRYFRRFESKVIGNLPAVVRKPMIALAKKIRSRRHDRAYVSAPAFEANVSRYLERCERAQVARVILIGIPLPDMRGLGHNPQLKVAVENYNRILARLAAARAKVDFIDPLRPEAAESALYVEDGYHLSPHGHAVVFGAISDVLRPREE